MYLKFQKIQAAGAFYLDRLLTLGPLYFLVAIATMGLVGLFGPSTVIHYFAAPFSTADAAYTLSLFPLQYSFYPFDYKSNVIPPAWSLASEAHFYLLVPLLFRNGRLLVALFFCTAAFHLYALTQTTGLVNADTFGFRYLPGVLAVFLFGALNGGSESDRAVARMYGVFCAVLLAFLGSALDLWKADITVPLVIGLALCQPLLMVCLNMPRTRIDQFLGKVAYPLFLVHSLCIYLVEKLAPGIQMSKPVFFVAAMALSILVSWGLAAFQVRVVDSYRYRRLQGTFATGDVRSG